MQNCHADSQNLSLGKIVDFHNFFEDPPDSHIICNNTSPVSSDLVTKK